LINAAKVDYYSGRFQQAIDLLYEASRQTPEGELTNDALDHLEMLRTSSTDSVNLELFARAELESRLGNHHDAESLFYQVAQETGIGDLAERALLKLSALQRKDGRIEEAIRILESIQTRFSNSLRAADNLLQLGHLYQNELGDINHAIEIYEKILVDYPESLQVDEARRRLRQLEQPET
jgi:tetratricopeptide (TPR) repeat protein